MEKFIVLSTEASDKDPVKNLDSKTSAYHLYNLNSVMFCVHKVKHNDFPTFFLIGQ